MTASPNTWPDWLDVLTKRQANHTGNNISAIWIILCYMKFSHGVHWPLAECGRGKGGREGGSEVNGLRRIHCTLNLITLNVTTIKQYWQLVSLTFNSVCDSSEEGNCRSYLQVANILQFYKPHKGTLGKAWFTSIPLQFFGYIKPHSVIRRSFNPLTSKPAMPGRKHGNLT